MLLVSAELGCTGLRDRMVTWLCSCPMWVSLADTSCRSCSASSSAWAKIQGSVAIWRYAIRVHLLSGGMPLGFNCNLEAYHKCLFGTWTYAIRIQLLSGGTSLGFIHQLGACLLGSFIKWRCVNRVHSLCQYVLYSIQRYATTETRFQLSSGGMPIGFSCYLEVCHEGSVAIWRYAMRVQLLSGRMPLGFSCYLEVCHHGSLAIWTYAVRVQLLSGGMPLWFTCYLEVCHYGSLAIWRYAIMVHLLSGGMPLRFTCYLEVCH